MMKDNKNTIKTLDQLDFTSFNNVKPAHFFRLIGIAYAAVFLLGIVGYIADIPLLFYSAINILVSIALPIALYIIWKHKKSKLAERALNNFAAINHLSLLMNEYQLSKPWSLTSFLGPTDRVDQFHTIGGSIQSWTFQAYSLKVDGYAFMTTLSPRVAKMSVMEINLPKQYNRLFIRYTKQNTLLRKVNIFSDFDHRMGYFTFFSKRIKLQDSQIAKRYRLHIADSVKGSLQDETIVQNIKQQFHHELEKQKAQLDTMEYSDPDVLLGKEIVGILHQRKYRCSLEIVENKAYLIWEGYYPENNLLPEMFAASHDLVHFLKKKSNSEPMYANGEASAAAAI